LSTLHTLTFYQDLMKEARKQILMGTFEGWKAELVGRWATKN
jgi:queuine/archaeosine tRNA-ribosyltransferase